MALWEFINQIQLALTVFFFFDPFFFRQPFRHDQLDQLDQGCHATGPFAILLQKRRVVFVESLNIKNGDKNKL